MEYLLKNNKWEVSYIDSNGGTQSFLHPTKIRNIPKFIESGDKDIMEITEEKIKSTFPSDEITETIVNSIKNENGTFGENEEFWD